MDNLNLDNVRFVRLKFFDAFSICLFHESVSSVSDMPLITDLIGSTTKLLRLMLETVWWCCLSEQKKNNWVFDSFNESLVAARQLTSLFNLASIISSIF